jgi:hypothetical protein
MPIGGNSELMWRGGFVDGAITMTDVIGDQPGLWQECVLLNEEFYRALREHPVPLSESRAIGPRQQIPRLAAFARHREMRHALARVLRVLHRELTQLFAPQRVEKESGEDGAVALALDRVGLGRIEQLADLVIAKRRRGEAAIAAEPIIRLNCWVCWCSWSFGRS